MAFATWAFGAYSVSYDPAGATAAADVGLIESHVTMNQQMAAQDITCSRYADTVIDGIYRGGNVFVQIILKEWKTAAKLAMYPFDTDLGLSGVTGRAMSDIAGVLLLTALVGTPAITNGPVTRSFPKAVFSPGHNMEVLFGNVERNVPIVFQCLPVEETAGSSVARWFTDT